MNYLDFVDVNLLVVFIINHLNINIMMSSVDFEKLCNNYKLTQEEKDEYKYYANYQTVESIKQVEMLSDETLGIIFKEYEKIITNQFDKEKTINLLKEYGIDILNSNDYWWAGTIFREIDKRKGNVPKYYFEAIS